MLNVAIDETSIQAKTTVMRPLSLSDVLEALAGNAEKVLDVQTMDGMIGEGYHITEVKAGAFTTVDCGGNPDQWNETVLQIEDRPLSDGRQMTAGKFAAIVSAVQKKVILDGDARLTIEEGPTGVPMRVHDVTAVLEGVESVTLVLSPRNALCKPQHREEVAGASACCAPKGSGQKCCG